MMKLFVLSLYLLSGVSFGLEREDTSIRRVEKRLRGIAIQENEQKSYKSDILMHREPKQRIENNRRLTDLSLMGTAELATFAMKLVLGVETGAWDFAAEIFRRATGISVRDFIPSDPPSPITNNPTVASQNSANKIAATKAPTELVTENLLPSVSVTPSASQLPSVSPSSSAPSPVPSAMPVRPTIQPWWKSIGFKPTDLPTNQGILTPSPSTTTIPSTSPSTPMPSEFPTTSPSLDWSRTGIPTKKPTFLSRPKPDDYTFEPTGYR